MTSGSIARRYARALYELAAEEGSVEQTGAALAELAAAIEEAGAEDLAEGLLTTEQRRRIAASIAEQVDRGTILGKFVFVVAEHDRLAYLPAIARWYRRLEDQAAGRVRLDIAVAHPLEDADVERIRAAFARITGRRPVARTRVDGELLAGAVVEVEGRVYDGSVRTALARLAERMAGATE